MDFEYLRKYAESFLNKNYRLSLKIPLTINNRLRVTQGSFVTNYNETEARRIELSGDLIQYGTENVILDTLRHELVHYALFSLGKPFDDGDDYFENELKKLNVSATETVYVGIDTVYKCSKCNQEYETSLKKVWKTPNIYKTVCCGEKISVLGRRIYNGEKDYMVDQVV